MFAAARRFGRLSELDWICRASAFNGALAANLGRTYPLFVNVEADAMAAPMPAEFREVTAAASEELRIVLEITERRVTADPRGLLGAIAAVRRQGWQIALDDVGSDATSLALMPLIKPDIIKLDLRLIQDPGHSGYARVIAAVEAEAERTGARVLAEGIETTGHLRVAQSIGASLGQGYFYGRPGMLPANQFRSPIANSDGVGPRTPYSIIANRRPVRRAAKNLLLPISMQLEQMAVATGEIPVVLGCFQHGRHFTPRTTLRWQQLAREAVLVVALGVALNPEIEGIRTAELSIDDPLGGEWDIIALGPHFSAALVARDLGDTGPDQERRFDYVLTYDRNLVIEAAESLMTRVVPVLGAVFDASRELPGPLLKSA